MTYIRSLKGSAASEVGDALFPHVGHRLEAVEKKNETFPRLQCVECDVDLLELDE